MKKQRFLRIGRPMTEAERSRYQVPDGAKAGICKGFVLSKYLVLLDRGVPWDAAQNLGEIRYVADLDTTLSEIETAFEADEPGEVITIEIVEMTLEELDKLPEFDGW